MEADGGWRGQSTSVWCEWRSSQLIAPTERYTGGNTPLTVTMLGGGQEVKCIVGGWMALIDGLSCFYFQVLAFKVSVSDMGFPKKKQQKKQINSLSMAPCSHQWCFVWLTVSLSSCCWMRSEVLTFSPRGTELTNACQSHSKRTSQISSVEPGCELQCSAVFNPKRTEQPLTAPLAPLLMRKWCPFW